MKIAFAETNDYISVHHQTLLNPRAAATKNYLVSGVQLVCKQASTERDSEIRKIRAGYQQQINNNPLNIVRLSDLQLLP